jgi:RNA polymerase sigma-70 factor (ECF subfamily)
LTQDTFVRAIRHLPTYKENGTPIRAWLTTIAKNLVYDYHAKRNLRVAHIDLKEAKKIGITDVQTALSDRLMALKELPNETQKIFILLYVFEYSYEEVGKLTNKSVPAIKGLVFKAKEYFLKKNIPLTDL